MMDRNLGNVERVVRILFALAFALWVFVQPAMNGVEWFVALVSLALMLNGIFSRCYLWYVLEIDTHEESDGRQMKGSAC